MTDWYRANAGHYWRGTKEQVMYRNREWAAAIGGERAGCYYRRLLPTRRVVRGPYRTMREAMGAARGGR